MKGGYWLIVKNCKWTRTLSNLVFLYDGVLVLGGVLFTFLGGWTNDIDIILKGNFWEGIWCGKLFGGGVADFLSSFFGFFRGRGELMGWQWCVTEFNVEFMEDNSLLPICGVRLRICKISSIRKRRGDKLSICCGGLWNKVFLLSVCGWSTYKSHYWT